MRYYYFNPFTKQYYFPEGFHNYPIFSTFYKPYKFMTRVLWKSWRTSALFRNLYTTNEPEKFLPIENVKKYVSPSSILAFNMGKPGNGHNVNVLSVDTETNEMYFIKYATSDAASKNVLHEGIILEQLSHLPFVPKLQLYANEKGMYTLIKTNVFQGSTMRHEPHSKQIMELLFTLAEQYVESNIRYNSDLRTCFAHGDFCPWNMFCCQGTVKIFDWEMAGQYPLGYDLFTYLFQYEFLVNQEMQFFLILEKNEDVIEHYFRHFEIDDWVPYLYEFSRIKYELDSKKKTKSLLEPYLKLNEYAAALSDMAFK